ncbi:CAP domain-containing protein [Staphylococcus pasteuri]|uniref:CAP domain-containing protein n=1 Tax=Staphylococcus pasteuri TaxID=45972 RepID=UPI000D3D0743|nr:CAP domain-containing protein [Staphylococcus pasteuri]PTU82284.1 secretion protein [Staphylococcus pasteuri]RIO34294.1 CAP domain-containing protein [Staphylococcus pasteuri]
MAKIKRFLVFFIFFLCLVIFLPLNEFKFTEHLQQEVREQVDQWAYGNSNEEDLSLDVPDKQEFAINNIQMNMTKKDVEDKLGKEKRITTNEYGTHWYTYYDNDYNQFIMISYIKNRVNGMYTNQNLISSQSKIKYATPKKAVRDRLGKPIEEISKGNKRFEVKNDEYDIFHKNHIYTTVFYDKHEKNGVTALYQVSEAMENRLQEQYGAPSKSLEKSFELQNFDIVNAERKQHQLPTLKYSASVSNTARKHSQDMADNNYFDHTDLKGKSPFDRLKDDHHDFSSAGENFAYGQQSSIFAHEGLMNSLGHRKNILNDSFSTLGVGVDFNDRRQPYWTENYTG